MESNDKLLENKAESTKEYLRQQAVSNVPTLSLNSQVDQNSMKVFSGRINETVYIKNDPNASMDLVGESTQCSEESIDKFELTLYFEAIERNKLLIYGKTVVVLNSSGGTS